MKLAKYWARSAGAQRYRGWSNESIADARRKADQIREAVARRIASGPPDRGDYLYGDRPLPEPVLEELPGAVITRNVYGAEVLNCASLMFLDVDSGDVTDSPAALDLFSGLRSLFGTPASPPVKSSPAETKMEGVARQHNLGLRIYRTAAGYRGIVTNLAFDPRSAQTRALLHDFACDPLYVRLCQAQQSFRARLTPKPWRCGLAAPPVSFPFEGPAEEDAFQQWLRRYRANSAGNATCRLVRAIGPAAQGDAALLIERHDRDTKAASRLPLA